MANVLAHLSSILIPAVIFFIIGYGWIHKCNLYDNFINGAADGLKTVVRLFSSSAATGLVLDIFKTYGTDSLAGRITSILMSCTETCFYTMSVYFMTARVSKSRYTLAGALLSTAVGVIMSVLLAYLM